MALQEFLDELARGLEDREKQGLRRRLADPRGIDFSSNDYLGLSRHPRLRARMMKSIESDPVGAPSARLLSGNPPVFRRLEERLARFKGAEAGLFFPSGYQANIGLMAGLIRPQDRALSDAQNHASIIDGLRLSRCARVVYPHVDLAELEARLREPHPGGRTFIVTESYFSMDGDIAPLDRIAALADRHGALLLVDESHATGLFGKSRGSGLIEFFGVEDRVAAALSTCGKAIGLAGGAVTGSAAVIEHLINHARPFIFTTAPLPILAAGILAALDVIAEEPWRRDVAFRQAGLLRQELVRRRVEASPGEGPIVPIPIGDNQQAIQAAMRIQDAGYDVRALRPPSVPPGTARLRISVNAGHTAEEIEGVAEAVATALVRRGPGARR